MCLMHPCCCPGTMQRYRVYYPIAPLTASRWPAKWNIESLKILINQNCVIFTTEKVMVPCFWLNKTKPFFPFRKKHHAPLPKHLDVSSCVPMLPPIVSTPWQPQRLKQKSRPQISLDAQWRKRVLISCKFIAAIHQISDFGTTVSKKIATHP